MQLDSPNVPARPLARYLVLLLVTAILPLLVIASVLIWRQVVDQRAETERAMVAAAHATSLAVDRQINSYRLMLQALAQSELIDRGDFAAFHAYAKRVADSEGAVFVSLFDPAGRHLLNTSRPYGAPLADPFRQPQPAAPGGLPTGDVSSLQRVFATGRPSNSDLFVGLTTRRLQFTVDVPVIRHGTVVYALNAAFTPDRIAELLKTDDESGRLRSGVIDGRGFILARWAENDRFAGVAARPETTRMLDGRKSAAAFMQSVDGTHVFRTFVRSPMTGWYTAVSVEAEEIRRAERNTWLIWGAAALAALLVSVGLATRLARALARSIGRLADAASVDQVPRDYGLRSRELDRLRDALAEGKEFRAAALRARDDAVAAGARQQEAEAANREKDRFMAAVVHELRNPLAALTNVTALLRSGVHDERVSGIVERQVGQLTRLVDDLMESARVEFGKFRLQVAPVDLRDVVKQAVEGTSVRHRHRHQVLDLQLPEAPVTVLGDRARLYQVVTNLVDNAMKFSRIGGAIGIDLAARGGHAVLDVTDSGGGIDPGFLPHVFDRFTQGPGTSGAGEGLGLGLSVARDLVLAHRGRIEAANEAAGARFTVTLPLAAD